jgi:N-methylhydantoinase A
MRVGIEVGSTFTDLVAVDGSRVEVIKVPSTPASPDKGAFASLEAAGLDPAGVTDLVHGSTGPAKRSAERLREDQADGIISADRAASWPLPE